MHPRSERPSAEIYQFPKGGRSEWRRYDVRDGSSERPTPVIVCTDAWYHQAAVEDDKIGSC